MSRDLAGAPSTDGPSLAATYGRVPVLARQCW
jgi:hypothetical protein